MRLIDSCITQLKAQGPSRTCNESKEEEKKKLPGEERPEVREAKVDVRAFRTFGRTLDAHEPSLSRKQPPIARNLLRAAITLDATAPSYNRGPGPAREHSAPARQCMQQGPCSCRREGPRTLTKQGNKWASGWPCGGNQGTLRRDERADEAAREEGQEEEKVQDRSEHRGDGRGAGAEALRVVQAIVRII